MSVKFYARVENGVIVEKNVAEHHIVNRGHDRSEYREALFGEQPIVGATQRLAETWSLHGDIAIVTYKVVELSLQELINMINAPIYDQEDKKFKASEVDASLVKLLVARIKEAAHDKLSEFAQTRHYDDIGILATYANSTNETRRQEGQRGVDLRDAVWDHLIALEADFLAGTGLIPRTIMEITSQLPALTWED